MLFSHVKVSCFRAKAHLVFYWCLYNKTRSSSFVFLLLLSFFIGVSWSENATVPQACSSLRDSRVRENKTGRNWGVDRRPPFPRFHVPFTYIYASSQPSDTLEQVTVLLIPSSTRLYYLWGTIYKLYKNN